MKKTLCAALTLAASLGAANALAVTQVNAKPLVEMDTTYGDVYQFRSEADAWTFIAEYNFCGFVKAPLRAVTQTSAPGGWWAMGNDQDRDGYVEQRTVGVPMEYPCK